MNTVTTVVIPHLNRAPLLRECLLSLRAQTDGNHEVIVVDNRSTDESLSMLEGDFPEVRVIRFSENRGFAAAVNEGIRSVRSEFVLLLNNDLILEPDFLETLRNALEKAPDAEWAAPKTLRDPNRETIDNCGLFLSKTGIARKRFAGFPDREAGTDSRWILGAAGNAAFFRNDFFRRVGLFEERFFAYCEDWDLAFRAKKMEMKCLYVPDARCYHKESATWGRNSPETLYYFQRNMELAFFSKSGPGLRYILPHLLYSAYCVLRWIWRGKGEAALRAKGDALRMLRGKEPRHRAC